MGTRSIEEQQLRDKLIQREDEILAATQGDPTAEVPVADLQDTITVGDLYWAAIALHLDELYGAARKEATEDDSEVVMETLEKGLHAIRAQYRSPYKVNFRFDPRGEMPLVNYVKVFLGSGKGGKTLKERRRAGVLGKHVLKRVRRLQREVSSSTFEIETGESEDAITERLRGDQSFGNTDEEREQQRRLYAAFAKLSKLKFPRRLAIVAHLLDELTHFDAPEREKIIEVLTTCFAPVERRKAKIFLRNALKSARDETRTIAEIIAPYAQVTAKTVKIWQTEFFKSLDDDFDPSNPRFPSSPRRAA